MSAFVVSDDHINALITWAAVFGASYSYDESSRAYFRENEQHCAALLYTANVESVNDRYSDEAISTGFVFRHYEDWRKLTPVIVLKLCNCFDYQACEVKKYRNTIAAQIIDGIRTHAIGLLPGYEFAPWGI